MMGNGDRIAITGIGLVCSLGLDAPSSLAAIRCDIANFSKHETVMVHADHECTELEGATIARLPEALVEVGLHGAARAAALLAPAIRQSTARLPLVLIESAQWRLHGGAGIDNDDLMNLLAGQGVLQRSPTPPLAPVDPSLGRCHFFENIMQAATGLLNSDAPLAIVGCVDSLCDDPILLSLADADGLKSSTNPEAIVAGEAAGVFVLELESHVRRRNGLAFAYLAATGRGSDPSSLPKQGPSNASGLRNAFIEAFADLPRNGGEVDMVIADLNGERARAEEWAITAPRIFPRDEKRRELKHPADCAGDCGAAMGTILLATAIDILLRASEPSCLAATTSDPGGARRVICLQKGDLAGIDAHFQTEGFSQDGVVIGVLQQHFVDASFLWLTRPSSVDPLELKRRDQRIEWNLTGLLHGGEAVWRLCQSSQRYGDPGDFFVAASVAFGTANHDLIEYVRKEAGSNEALIAAITAGTNWASHYRHMCKDAELSMGVSRSG